MDKKCKVCSVIKNVNFFHKLKNGFLGYNSTCKDCRSNLRRSKTKPCDGCGKEKRANKNKLCYKCSNSLNPRNYKGGKIVDTKGYVSVISKGHPAASKQGNYVKEHRLIMEAHLGRYLLPYENIHHKNGIRSDNRIENLELWSKSQPYGQRVEDKLKWAREIIELYKDYEIK